MYPVIANIGPFTISSIGLFISLGFFFGSFKIWRKAKEEHFEDEDIFDIIFVSLFGGLVFARLFYVLLNFGYFGFRISRWIDLASNNGFSWIGFLVGVMISGSVICKNKKLDFWQFMDITVPGVIVSQIFVLVGLFLDCSYYGKVSSLPWAIELPGVTGARHPLPFYEIIILLIVLYMQKWLDRRYRLFKWYQNSRGKANPGFLWLFYLLIFVVSQFLLSVIMVNEPILGPFDSYQILSVMSVLIVGFMFWMRAGNEIKLIDDNNDNRPQTLMVRREARKEMKKKDEEKKELEVIRPVTKTPAMTVKTRERKIAPKRFSRGKQRIG